jgi:hypothetical protein
MCGMQSVTLKFGFIWVRLQRSPCRHAPICISHNPKPRLEERERERERENERVVHEKGSWVEESRHVNMH